jgi:WD40 repeat protein
MALVINKMRPIWLLFAFLWLEYPEATGQYFGQNKPKYYRQPISMLETGHFTWYHSLEKNRPLLDNIISDAEFWHAAHSRLFRDSLIFENPIVLYNDNAAFQQTLAESGYIHAGKDGISEALNNRTVLPLAFTYRQTKQRLGYELVHVFQTQALQLADSTDLDHRYKVPLWLIEGMARYFSLGRTDPHTAMWMRDAVIHDDLPSLSALSDYSKYDPSRFGHAFAAFLGGEYGDQVIVPFFMRTALVGVDQACRDILGSDPKALFDHWIQSQKKACAVWLSGDKPTFPPNLLNSVEGDKKHHQFAPSVSPDGRFVVFMSDQSGAGMGLYLAEVRSGIVLRKLRSPTTETDMDAIPWMESSGTWSPDSRHFSYVDFQRGRNVLIIIDVEKPRSKKVIPVSDLSAFTTPAWSPDGKSILLTGMNNGQTDLYLFHLLSRQLTALTRDEYSEVHPAWSPDGQCIYFASDEGNPQGKGRSFQLVTMRADGTEKKILNVFPGADNLNPQVDKAGNVYFLSDRDGFRQLYLLEPNTGNVAQLTHFHTGISGPSHLTPALSMSRQPDQPTLIYSLFQQRKYALHELGTNQSRRVEVDADDVDLAAAVLPPLYSEKSDIVESNLSEWGHHLPDSTEQVRIERAYKTRMNLDYIGNGTGMGIHTANGLGANTILAGGTDILFSDLMDEHQLYSGIAINGNWRDAAAVVQYVNRKNRIFWGISAAHIPFRSGTLTDIGPASIVDETGQIQTAWQYNLLVNRVFQDKVNLILQYPFSRTLRLEMGIGYTLLYERRELISQYYSELGYLIGEQKWRIPTPGRAHIACQMMAAVGDNSRFGMASPAEGWRYRVALEANQGDILFLSTLLDFRRYIYRKPFTFACRLIQFNRFGGDSDRLLPLFTADPMLIRGFQSISPDEFQRQHQLDAGQLSGNRLIAGNLEWRFPLTGVRTLALIPSRFLFTELALFSDAGITWSPGESNQAVNGRPAFLASAGLSLRIRIAGAFIVEPYYAFPVIRGQFRSGALGINLIPGW